MLAWTVRRFVVAPAVVGLTVLVWFSLPPAGGRGRALGLRPGTLAGAPPLWIAILYLTIEALMLLIMWGA